MRPVIKGGRPKDSKGNYLVFKKYQDASPELKRRLGKYCSYCEARVPIAIHVEHVKPKAPDRNPQLTNDWDNFLLCCASCNPSKSDKDIALENYFFPHIDNTFRAFAYKEDIIIDVNGELPQAMQARAERTLKLFNLDATPDTRPDLSTDRWDSRKTAWKYAKHSKLRLSDDEENDRIKEQIVETALASGHWSIWMTVFKDDVDMLRRLSRAFPGTALECFDENCLPLPRNANGI